MTEAISTPMSTLSSGMCSANPVLLQNPPAGPPVRKGDGATLYVP